MDQQLTPDQTAILAVLEPMKLWSTPYAQLQYEIISDFVHQHFQVCMTGWDGTTRVHSLLVHIVIRDNFIWLEEDLTDADIAEKLVQAGITRDRIVLGFQAPYKRGMYGFAQG
jgi:hypothetical protein